MSAQVDTPRPSTSKDNAPDGRFSLATSRTAFQDPPPATPVHPVELRRDVVTTSALPQSDDGFFTGCASSLAKLQTYLPTGTWVTYTALETWAFSLRPNEKPVSPFSNCNSHQRTALIIIIALCAAIAFGSSFVKRFVYDSSGKHVVYPPPDYFTVPQPTTEPLTGVQFPCRTRGMRYCWPLVNDDGEFVYDEIGARLRVAVFRPGVPVLARRRGAWRWRACLGPHFQDDDVPPAPQLSAPSPLPPPPPPSRVFSIDAIALMPPELTPRWTHTLLGSQGSSAYFDLRAPVWGHALVSLVAFGALALCSSQVTGCLYPSIPDYLPPPLQTGVLVALSVVAAVGVRDGAVGFGQQAVRLRDAGPCRNEVDTQGEVPQYLQSVVEMVVWVGRQDLLKEKA